MREFIKVKNTFKFPELCNSLLQNFKSIAIVILELIKYLSLLNIYLGNGGHAVFASFNKLRSMIKHEIFSSTKC